MKIYVNRTKSATQPLGQNLAEVAAKSLAQFSDMYKPRTLKEMLQNNEFNEVIVTLCKKYTIDLEKANEFYADIFELFEHTRVIPMKELGIVHARINFNDDIEVSFPLASMLHNHKVAELKILNDSDGQQDLVWEFFAAVAQVIAIYQHGKPIHRFQWQVIFWCMGFDPLAEYYDKKSKEALADGITDNEHS